MTLSRRTFLAGSAATTVMLAAGCGSTGSGGTKVKIAAGSENKLLEEILQDEAGNLDAEFEITYMGSVDMARLLQANGAEMEYDILWPAHSMWLTLGDSQSVVRDAKSIVRTPVVFSLKREIALQLGWAKEENGEYRAAKDVTMDDILKAADDGAFRFAMTNATQSNSGASAYLAMCYAFSGHPSVLTQENLDDPTMADQVKQFLGLMDRSSGSSGFLVDLMVADYDHLDAMFNYEAMVIELNQKLADENRDPFFVVYPVDGMVISDSPFALVDKQDEKKSEIFRKTQEYLLSENVQKELLQRGRRNGDLGLNLSWDEVDQDVFNPDWGIDVERVLTSLTVPEAGVIWNAFTLYQTSLRKPSAVVFCLDFSGSMAGDGEHGVKEAMNMLLDPEKAEQYLLQTAPDDFTAVVPFEGTVTNRAEIDDWIVRGNSADDLSALDSKVQSLSTGGGTDIYEPVAFGYEILSELIVEDYSAAIVLLTDGKSTESYKHRVHDARASYPDISIPIYSILMGEAEKEQLDDLAALPPTGRVFDGREGDLSAILREVRGYL